MVYGVCSIQQSKEVVDGLRVIFDFTLPLVLLYDCERDQYNGLLHFNSRQQQCNSPSKSYVDFNFVLDFILVLLTSVGWTTTCSANGFILRHICFINHQQYSLQTDWWWCCCFWNSLNWLKWLFIWFCRRPTPCVSPRFSSDNQYNKSEDEIEIVFKNDSTKIYSSPRQRRKTKTTETAGSTLPQNSGMEVGQKRLRRSSRDLPRHGDKDSNIVETMISSPNKFAFGSPSSSRASSPERPPPKLTCMEDKHIASTCEVFNWSLIPRELYSQVPAPPSLIYGAHHLLRLFG